MQGVQVSLMIAAVPLLITAAMGLQHPGRRSHA
jgi:hypothetical protein